MSANTGWICPRCSVVNGPMVQRCSCTAHSGLYPHIYKPPYEVDGTDMFKVHPNTVSYGSLTGVHTKDMWNV